jgi:glyoxylase-like metal-dependent hydrolase (beta-lactamase superfamily II)
MKLASNIAVLEISADIMGSPGMIYPTLITDRDTLILVDTGFPGQTFQLQRAVEKEDIEFKRLTTVILTHHDIDHIGGLADIRKRFPGQISVLAHSEEIAYIQGEKTPLKVAQFEANLHSMTGESRAFFEIFKGSFHNAVTWVDQPLTDGELLPYAGGIKVIHTPGHTLGHICLYCTEKRILIAGDALRVENGLLDKTPPTANNDSDLYKKSLEKLAKIDIETVICYHGGFYDKNTNRRIADLAGETNI